MHKESARTLQHMGNTHIYPAHLTECTECAQQHTWTRVTLPPRSIMGIFSSVANEITKAEMAKGG